MPYIDRDIAIEVLKSNVEELEADPYYGPHPGVPEQYIEDILIDEVPAADVVKVVRCKNCRFRYTPTCSFRHETADDGYCSDGDTE